MTNQDNPFSLDGRHIVVTGGGRGLGRGIAIAAARAGATVTVIARSRDQLGETVSAIAEFGGDGRSYTMDVAQVEDIEGHVEAIWAAVGPVDGVVHAAGVQRRKIAVNVDVADWRFVQTVNVEGPFFLTTAIARRQLSSGSRGSHVFVGSLNSTIGLPFIAPYAASKTALLGMARSISTEWAASGLRANVIGPGYFHTELTDELLADPDNRRRIIGRIPMGRLGTPSDLGGAAVFLLSDASSYMTGQLLNVDGGWLAA